VWLQVVHGEVTLDDVVLSAGDGAGEAAELLLLDLGVERP
jgi:hypothetical protein